MSIYTGKTINDAIQTGLKQLQIKRSDATINIIQTGRKGFLGIGRRAAKVEITSKKKKPSPVLHHSARPKAPVNKPHNQNQDQSHQKKNFTIKQRKPKPIHLKHHQIRVKNHHGSQQSEHLDRHQQNEVAIKKLENYLGSVIRLLGISATMKATFETSKQVHINFETHKEGLLIGKHGLTINALQALSEIFLNRLGMYHLYVELDTADYRQRRMEILGRLAKKTAREAVATGKPVYLDPMPSFERKKIHKTLEDSAHVMTYSAGREPYRAVVVAPK